MSEFTRKTGWFEPARSSTVVNAAGFEFLLSVREGSPPAIMGYHSRTATRPVETLAEGEKEIVEMLGEIADALVAEVARLRARDQ